MSIIRQDTFNRTDSALSIGSPSDGLGAYTEFGTWGIGTNQGYLVDPSAFLSCVLDASTADVEIQFTLSTYGAVAGVSGPAIVARKQDSTNMIWLGINTAAFSLATLIASSYTEVASGACVPANGDIVKLVCNGNTLTAYLNGSQICQATGITTFNTQTMHGLGSYSDTTTRFDDLTISTISAGGTVIPVFMNQYRQRRS